MVAFPSDIKRMMYRKRNKFILCGPQRVELNITGRSFKDTD